MQYSSTERVRDRVRDLMYARGWSQSALAAKSGVSQSRIAYLLNYRDHGDRHPTTKVIDQLADAFGLSAWQLLQPQGPSVLGVAEPQPLDATLLATSLRECISVFHSLGRLPSFDELAASAVHMYARVQTGIPLERAARQVSIDLDQISKGTLLATSNESSGGDSTHGQRHPRTHRRSQARTD